MSSDVQAAYTAWSATYDTDPNLTRDLDQVVMHTLLAGRRYGSILELGCGTGKNTALLASVGVEVHALDFSEGMLAQAHAKQPGANVRFSVADLTEPWPCADRWADLLVANLVLEHIADLDFIFAEARRVLRQPGQFLISELHPFKQYLGSKARFQRDDQQIAPTAFVHHISDFLGAAEAAGLRLEQLREWWHAAEPDAPPRLVSFVFATDG